MNILEVIILVIMAGVLGVAAQKILGTKYGMVVSVILGIVGAAVGTFLSRAFHFPAVFTINIGGTHVEIVWALLGALLVTFGAGIIAKSNKNASKK